MEIGIISTALMITVLLLLHTQLWQTLHLTGVTDWLSLSWACLMQPNVGWLNRTWSKFNYCESIHMYRSYRKYFKWGLWVHLLFLLISTTSDSFNSKQFPELQPAFTRPTLDLWEWKSTKTLVWESLSVRYPIFLNCWWSPKKFPIYLQSSTKLLLSGFSGLQKSEDCNQFCTSKK
jgi:hypothetical protein